MILSRCDVDVLNIFFICLGVVMLKYQDILDTKCRRAKLLATSAKIMTK